MSKWPLPRSSLGWFVAGALLALLPVVMFAALKVACELLGKTPGELLAHARHRLQGHPGLQRVASPVLTGVFVTLGGADEFQNTLPFSVPALPPNPMARVSRPSAETPGVIRVGAERAIKGIAAAARLARDGNVVEIDPGDYVADVAVWSQDDITIRGMGASVRLIARGADAEGKAIWVFRGNNATVENIQFVGARAEDGNGAGIRLERGRLLVRACVFIANQNGILTSDDAHTRLEVEGSEFGYNGAGDGLTHGIYAGRIENFRLSGSYLHHGNVGHLVKSRAQHSRIEYNRLTDESGGRSSYEIDLPNGGVAELVGNVVQQQEGTSNSTLISFGAEGYRWPRNALHLAHNTIVNDLRLGGALLRVAKGADTVDLRNNVLVGPGAIFGVSATDSAGDVRLEWSDLVQPARQDYRLNARARAVLPGLAPTPPPLQPRLQYRHPAATQPLAGPPTLPGAVQ